MDKVLVAIVGFVGGIIVALIGAGVLFPPNEWSHPLEKSATAGVEVTISAVPYYREVSIEGYVSGLAEKDGSWMIPVIQIDGEKCNTGNKTYKNRITSPELEATDFCLGVIPKNKAVKIVVTSEQDHIASKLAKLVVKIKQLKRSLL